MADLVRATGQPIKFTIGGEELTLSPITIGDLAAFEKECKEQRIAEFLKAAKTMKMERVERNDCVTRIVTMPFTNDDFTAGMATASGIRFLLWRSISKTQPKFTIEKIDELADLEELMNALTAISNLGRVTDENPTQPEPEKSA